jgi:hypothetical protein
MLYFLLRSLLSLFLKKPLIIGYNNLLFRGPKVLIANHANSYSPLFISVFFHKRTYPWVINNIISLKQCPLYIEEDFLIKELKLSRPLSLLVSFPLALICVLLMKYLKAIPVFKKTKKNSHTIRKSIEYLKKGKDLLIFPENQDLPFNEIFNGFDTGFFHLGPELYRKCGQRLSFIPIAGNSQENIISIGRPVIYEPSNPVRVERERVVSELEESILRLYTNNRLKIS